MTPNFSKARDLESILASMPAIEEAVEAQKRAIINRARLAQGDGVLTPELAQQLWAEFLASDGLLRSFERRIKAYQGAAAQASPLLTGTGRLE
jgi:hypothetical protein